VTRQLASVCRFEMRLAGYPGQALQGRDHDHEG
jgi:hypothetical protein